MVKFRIIPWLEIKGPNLIKGINMEGLRVLGDPNEFSNYYSGNGADEIIYHDVVASLYGRNSLLDTISSTAKKTFIPLTVSGGIRSIHDIQKVLEVGADRVCINSAAIKNINFVSKSAEIFGSSTICINIQTMKSSSGEYYCYYNNGRELTSIKVKDWVKIVEEKGAGEIILTSIDREGTFEGFDEELINKISQLVSIPIIIHGGCDGPNKLAKIIKKNKISGIAASSVFHYNYLKKYQKKRSEKNLSKEGNLEFLLNKNSIYHYDYDKIFSILEFKKTLKLNKINIRL